MEPDFQSESWEQTGPSYVQAYIVSAFVLVALLTVAAHRVPLTPLFGIFFSIWFGMCVYWIVENRHSERTFASDRITVANGRVTHCFRYAIPEALHSEMDVNDIKEMKVHFGEPVAIELIGSKDSDFFMLPNQDQVELLRLALQRLNPNLRVTK